MSHAYVTLNTAGSHSSGSETPVPSLSFLQNPLLTVLQQPKNASKTLVTTSNGITALFYQDIALVTSHEGCMSAVLVSVVLKGTDNHRASRAGRDPQPPPRPAPGSAQEHPKIKIQTIPLIERHPKYPGSKVSHAKRLRILHNYSPNTLCFQTSAGSTSTVTQQAGGPQEAVEAEGISEFREELEKRMGSRSVNR